MRARTWAVASLIVTLGLAAQAPTAPPKRGEVTTMHATGSFDVRLAPEGTTERAQAPPIGGMTIEKRFHGDLEGSGTGRMLTAGTAMEGSAAYVALEQVSGVLHGRRGTFVLVHRGIMSRGEPALQVTVVPDSGTDELAGLTGQLTITITGGKHLYALDYALPGLGADR